MTGFGQNIMDKSQLLSGLRRDIANLDGCIQTASAEGMFSLGDPAIDGKLPGGGLSLSAMHEIRGDAYRDAAAPGFMVGLLSCALKARAIKGEEGSILWCRRVRHSQTGFIYGPGLVSLGLHPSRFIFVTTEREEDALWAAEEGLKCAGIAAVVIEVDQLDLTSGRRLQLAAASAGLPVFVLNGHRQESSAALGATTAMSRWSVRSVSDAAWHVAMERCRGGAPRSWFMEWNDETHCFSVVAPVAHRAREIAAADFDKAA